MISVNTSNLLTKVIKILIIERINTKIDLSVQSATMMRVMSLPADFFKQYSSGELSYRLQQIPSLCSMLVSTVLGTGLTSIFSLIYIFQIFAYTPVLVIPALLIIITTVVFSIITTVYQIHISKKQMELGAKEGGMGYSLTLGVQKIKLSGSEKRAYSRWSSLYSKLVQITYNTPMFLRANATFSSIISLTGVIVMYYMAIQSGVSVADYYAFNTAYGMVSGAFMSIAGIATAIAQFKPILEMAKSRLPRVRFSRSKICDARVWTKRYY